MYTGKVVNITKFGAFVNVLPGRDGLLHISKIGGGKRIDRVEDVLNLGDEVEVRVDDIDNSGKLSLSLVGGEDAEGGTRRVVRPSEPGRRQRRSWRHAIASRHAIATAAPTGRAARRRAQCCAEPPSFEDAWEEQAKEEFGDLGPAEVGRSSSGGGGGGGGGGGSRRGGGGRRRR